MIKQVVKRRLKKVGGSLAVILPKEVLEDTGWKEGTLLQCVVTVGTTKTKGNFSVLVFTEPTPEGFLMGTFFKVLGKVKMLKPAGSEKEKTETKEKP